MTHRNFVKRRFRALCGLAFLWLSFGTSAWAFQTLSFAWDPSSDPSVTGYFLYYGIANNGSTIKVDAGTNTMATVTNLSEGQTYQFSIAAYDASGNESAPSMTISYSTPGLLMMQQPVASGPVYLFFPVAPGHWYDLQATVDFKSWYSIWQTPIETDYTWELFIDPSVLTDSARFYRLALH